MPETPPRREFGGRSAVTRWSLFRACGWLLRQDGEMAQSVYILCYGDDLGKGAPEAKLLGVYSSEAKAKDRIDRYLREGVSGFADHPEAFLIGCDESDKNVSVEGHIEVG